MAGTQLGAELLYAALDDFAPFAIEERESGARVFFTTSSQRDRAVAALSSRYEMSPVDVADDDWARRSQQNLQPITVGRVTIFPNLESRIISLESPTESRSPNPVSESRSPNSASPIHVVIPPSMGFGTGHHATTRLCLEALQTLDVTGKTVLDVGTGSGVLAIVAARLGARSATGIDIDPDAVQAARDNLGLNPLPRFGPRPADPAQDVEAVRFIVADLEKEPLPVADAGVDAGSARWDVVVANLTGALLVRSAPTLITATRPGGVVIASGLLREERDEVLRALTAPRGSLPSYLLEWERHEDDWVGLAVGTR